MNVTIYIPPSIIMKNFFRAFIYAIKEYLAGLV